MLLKFKDNLSPMKENLERSNLIIPQHNFFFAEFVHRLIFNCSEKFNIVKRLTIYQAIHNKVAII